MLLCSASVCVPCWRANRADAAQTPEHGHVLLSSHTDSINTMGQYLLSTPLLTPCHSVNHGDGHIVFSLQTLLLHLAPVGTSGLCVLLAPVGTSDLCVLWAPFGTSGLCVLWAPFGTSGLCLTTGCSTACWLHTSMKSKTDWSSIRVYQCNILLRQLSSLAEAVHPQRLSVYRLGSDWLGSPGSEWLGSLGSDWIGSLIYWFPIPVNQRWSNVLPWNIVMNIVTKNIIS